MHYSDTQNNFKKVLYLQKFHWYVHFFILGDSLSLVCVLFRGKRGAVCGKRLTFMYTSPCQHVEYNV